MVVGVTVVGVAGVVVETCTAVVDVVVDVAAANGVKDVEHAALPPVTLTTTVSPGDALPTLKPAEPWPLLSRLTVSLVSSVR